MAEAWERAVAAALKGHSEPHRVLNLDGAVKCPGGRLPPPSLFHGRLASLEHLSIANVRLSSLEGFPHLPALRRLVLSDNRIAGGLHVLAEAGLDALRDLDLSNNRIASLVDLSSLSKLRLESLDLYECPVTKIEGYRSKVFGLIASLKYLDKMDGDGNERPDTDDEEEEEEDEEDVGEEVENEEGEVEDDAEDEDEEEEEEGEEEEGNEDEEDEGSKQEGDEHNGTEEDKKSIAKNKNENGVNKDDKVTHQCNGPTKDQSSIGKRKRDGDP
ncbi:hypothetical protein Cni_G13824 [Canna indica]|uniref:Acidic leucine-rich nuclear phosphoprotein 32-related protein n=1 Tax=Canna indica TaxID=4628 RepID=A0AAQ3QD20_9LILI|nr:hypothetical protein Cni_G13824 [Canna indica]